MFIKASYMLNKVLEFIDLNRSSRWKLLPMNIDTTVWCSICIHCYYIHNKAIRLLHNFFFNFC